MLLWSRTNQNLSAVPSMSYFKWEYIMDTVRMYSNGHGLSGCLIQRGDMFNHFRLKINSSTVMVCCRIPILDEISYFYMLTHTRNSISVVIHIYLEWIKRSLVAAKLTWRIISCIGILRLFIFFFYFMKRLFATKMFFVTWIKTFSCLVVRKKRLSSFYLSK